MKDNKTASDTVLAIVDLFRQGFGVIRIAKSLDIEPEAVRRIIRGRAYRSITGGRLIYGKREAAKWRGGRRSFEVQS